LDERAAALLGRTLTANLLPLDAAADSGEMLTGLIGLPDANRSSSSHLYTYVNGRFVRDRLVQHAVLDGYRTLLEKRRFPVTVLFLDLPPEQVDVNVHPTKHEVRFRNQQQVHDFVAQAVRSRLLAAARPSVAVAVVGGAPVKTAETAATPAETAANPAATALAGVQEALAGYGTRHPAPPEVNWRDGGKGEALAWRPTSATAAPLPVEWRVIGQFQNSFLVCQAGEDLLLVDQHAAHERIGFEKLRRQLHSGGIEMQRLLLPVVIECDHRQAAVISTHLDDFVCLGFELEPFGGRAFSLQALPQLLAAADPVRLVLDMTEELAEIGSGSSVAAALEQVLQRLACHAVLRANQALTRAEMEALLCELAAIDFGSHCPHGRPVCKRISRGEIERFFHRS
jgi:DNA mismatch repair protein MutL